MGPYSLLLPINGPLSNQGPGTFNLAKKFAKLKDENTAHREPFCPIFHAQHIPFKDDYFPCIKTWSPPPHHLTCYKSTINNYRRREKHIRVFFSFLLIFRNGIT